MCFSFVSSRVLKSTGMAVFTFQDVVPQRISAINLFILDSLLTFVIVFFNFAISFMFELHQVDQHDCFFHIKEFRNEHWNSVTLFILRDDVFQLSSRNSDIKWRVHISLFVISSSSRYLSALSAQPILSSAGRWSYFMILFFKLCRFVFNSAPIWGKCRNFQKWLTAPSIRG